MNQDQYMNLYVSIVKNCFDLTFAKTGNPRKDLITAGLCVCLQSK